jgi:hypothetical protein
VRVPAPALPFTRLSGTWVSRLSSLVTANRPRLDLIIGAHERHLRSFAYFFYMPQLRYIHMPRRKKVLAAGRGEGARAIGWPRMWGGFDSRILHVGEGAQRREVAAQPVWRQAEGDGASGQCRMQNADRRIRISAARQRARHGETAAALTHGDCSSPRLRGACWCEGRGTPERKTQTPPREVGGVRGKPWGTGVRCRSPGGSRPRGGRPRGCQVCPRR